MTISNPSLTQISQALAEMLPKLKPLSVPTGMISAFHTVPEGWLQCNGAAVSRTTYAALFAVIGTKYGSGDGSTTFNLPNLHHKFIEGTNTTSEVGQSVSAGLPNITGGFGDAVWSGNARDAIHVGDVSLNKVNRNVTSGGIEISSWIDFDAWRSDALYGAASTVQPSALRMMLCIKF